MTSALTSCALALLLIYVQLHSMVVNSASDSTRPTDARATSFYTMYLPERCSTSSLSGFNKGVIISQRGDKYAPDTSCTLHLRVRSSARAIRLTFEHLDLPETRPGYCEDFVEFFTPSSIDNDALDSVAGPFCGRTLPSDFFTNGTSVVVKFSSNGIRERSGFRFRFERVSHAVELCGTDSASLHECSDSVNQPSFEQSTSSEWPLSRYCCYIIILVVGVYASWQQKNLSTCRPTASEPPFPRPYTSPKKGYILPR